MIYSLEDIKAFMTLKIDNNFKGVVTSLNQNGYSTKPIEVPITALISREDLGKFMFNIYETNKNMFVKILNEVPWNDKANNYTNNPRFQQSVLAMMAGLNK